MNNEAQHFHKSSISKHHNLLRKLWQDKTIHRNTQ